MPLADKECYFHFTMVDQLASAETCRVCGAPVNENGLDNERLCNDCVAAKATYGSGAQSDASPATEFDPAPIPQLEIPPDPDLPPWGPMAGIGVWIMSVAAIIVIPVIAVLVWYLIQSARGVPLPALGAPEELKEWLSSPNLLLVQVLSTMIAHAITIAICWAVVTKLGKRPFWDGLGWNWAGHPVWYWIVFSCCIIIGLVIVSQLLSRVLPQSEDNSFADLLKSSRQVRIAIAVLATFTAPLVEETVYRGVLYSSLRRSLGLIASVLVVTVMFVGVHVLQYWGAWVTVAGLGLLSLTLTVIRARTKSILPSVLIHTLNNAFFAVLIVANKG